MYYRGSRVPLGGRSAAPVPERSDWRSRAKEKPRDRMFRLSLKLVPGGEPKSPAPADEPGFYRPRRFAASGPGGAASASAAAPAWKGVRFPGGIGLPPVMGRLGGGALKAGLALALLTALVWSKVKTTDLLQQMSGLTLSKVSVEGVHYLGEDEVLKAAGAPMGENMFKLDLEGISDRVKRLSWVDRVFVERRLPKTLLISVRERKPLALLDAGDLYAVDGDERILAPSPALMGEDLPVISGVAFGPDAVGTTQAAKALGPALDLLAFLRKQDGVLAQDVSEVNVSEPQCLKVTFLDGVTARFNPVVTEKELEHMALVLGDLNAKGKKAASLDFRYKDEVLVRTR